MFIPLVVVPDNLPLEAWSNTTEAWSNMSVVKHDNNVVKLYLESCNTTEAWSNMTTTLIPP